jgi:hypothetical protein
MDDRTPRSEETRTARRRWQPASTLPEVTPKPGYGYRWVMTHLVGEEQPTNVSQRLREGYEPVSVKDHPEFMREANAKGEVKIGGLMLCKMPSEMLEDRKQYYEEQANRQVVAVNSKFLGQSDPRMPVFADVKSGSSRGRFGDGNT